jgi:D-glycero-alpha-D-manno-heptose 1-phosphate guanylyltransferase
MTEPPLSKTDVLILVGGQGKRLRPVIADRPKPMADMGGRPFLDLLIDYASAFGVQRFILCTGYKAESISDYYRRTPGPHEIVISHEDQPLGTAGAIKNAEEHLTSDPFLVMNGDSFCLVDLQAFLSFHLRTNALASMALVPTEDARDFGTVELNASEQVVRFEEKKIRKDRAFINAGIYLLGRDILSLIPTGTKYSLEYDLFPTRVGPRFYGYVVGAELIDIGTPERYERAREVLVR